MPWDDPSRTREWEKNKMKHNLTNEQIEAAAKAMYESQNSSIHEWNGIKWDDLALTFRSAYRQMAHDAAPFLQMPWSMPTYDEITVSVQLTDSSAMPSGRTRDRVLVEHFVLRRNAALIPNPMNARREVIASIIRSEFSSSVRQAQPGGPIMVEPNDMADRILAALDAKDAS